MKPMDLIKLSANAMRMNMDPPSPKPRRVQGTVIPQELRDLAADAASKQAEHATKRGDTKHAQDLARRAMDLRST